MNEAGRLGGRARRRIALTGDVAMWRNAIAAIRPAASSIALYLGFEGDIRGLGVSAGNVWIYETWDVEHAMWANPVEDDAPALLVWSPSLEDARHDPGP
jgi:hypothetical protein